MSRSLLQAFQELGRSLELGRTGDTVLAGAQVALPAADRATLTVLSLDGATVLVRRERGRRAAWEPRRRNHPTATPDGLVGRVLESGRPELWPGAERDPDVSAAARSALAAPVLGAGGRRLGALIVESKDAEAFDADAPALLRSWTSGAAPALERILYHREAVERRQLVSELEVAGRVLHDLLPRAAPRLDSMDLAAVYEPCAQVGGDYYDFIPLGEDRYGIAVADVSGKGVPAALLVGALRASVYSLASSSLALRAIFGRINRLLYESVGANRYAILFYGVLDVPLRRIVHINAGHLPPILARADGTLEEIPAAGLPVGLFPSPRYFEQGVQLNQGDLLALSTDGVVESENPAGEPYGRKRLAALLRRERDRETPASEICDRILAEARQFRGGAPDDDTTVVVLRAV